MFVNSKLMPIFVPIKHNEVFDLKTKKMKKVELTIRNVTDILNWYALEGQFNWGTWDNYPNLPIGASYKSFDTCHLRIILKGIATFKGKTFNCIADGHNVPGINLEVITINTLVALCKEEGIAFATEFMTSEKAKELNDKKVENARKIVEEFEEMATYQWQEPKVREQITNALNNVVVRKEFGKSIPETITGYALTIKNYCDKQQVTLVVDLHLKGRNSKRTAGYYKAAPIDIEHAVTLFTNERVASYSACLERHKQSLIELTK